MYSSLIVSQTDRPILFQNKFFVLYIYIYECVNCLVADAQLRQVLGLAKTSIKELATIEHYRNIDRCACVLCFKTLLHVSRF